MLRCRNWFLLACTLPFAACSSAPRAPVALPEMPHVGAEVALGDVPAREFDFWLGEWDVQNKHLRDGQWVDSGQARALIQSVAGGNAVLEQWKGAVGGDPLIGFSLRAFDPGLDHWAVYLNWHGGKPGGFNRMDAFRDGERMELFPTGDRSEYRYTFSQAREGSCRWDKATSKDGGTWVTDWAMQFTRRADGGSVDASSAPVVAPPDSAMRYHQLRNLDYLIGSWKGRAVGRSAEGRRVRGMASLRGSSMIEGFGMLLYLDTSWGGAAFTAAGFDAQRKSWVALRVDNVNAGIVELDGEIDDISYRFVSRGDDGAWVRESWLHFKQDAFRFERAISEDRGESWRDELAVDFERVDDVAEPGA